MLMPYGNDNKTKCILYNNANGNDK